MKNPVFVALDIDDLDKVLELAKALSPLAGGLKLGPRVVNRGGQAFVRSVADLAPVFVDQKFYDIPSTMDSAIRTAFESGASYCTIHALAGPESLRQVARLEAELRRKRDFRILVVTLLTSYTESHLPGPLKGQGLSGLVMGLAREAFEAGLRGFVCSPFEVTELKASFPEGFFVTPGVRTSGDDLNDQKRVTTPLEAMKKGASALVIGRPIIEASNPFLALHKVLESIGHS